MKKLLRYFDEIITFRVTIFLYNALSNNFRVNTLRRFGAKIGERCRIHAMILSTESYLLTIGDDVVIAQGTNLITHEGSIFILEKENPYIDLYGPIQIGNHCFIGMNCTILPNIKIGDNCIIGAGSVIRENIPDNSVVTGNPGKVIMSTQMYKQILKMKPMLYEYKRLNKEDKKNKILEKVQQINHLRETLNQQNDKAH